MESIIIVLALLLGFVLGAWFYRHASRAVFDKVVEDIECDAGACWDSAARHAESPTGALDAFAMEASALAHMLDVARLKKAFK